MFTALEIATALGGITKQAVLARLAGIPADGTKIVRGQAAQAWRAESFPVSLYAELEALCALPDGTRRFRTIGDLIAKRPAPSKALSLSDFPADALALAERKAEILAPLLHARAKSPEKWSLAEIARRACEHLADTPGGNPIWPSSPAMLSSQTHWARAQAGRISAWNPRTILPP